MVRVVGSVRLGLLGAWLVACGGPGGHENAPPPPPTYSISIDATDIVANPLFPHTISITGAPNEPVRVALDRADAGVLDGDLVYLDANGEATVPYIPCTNNLTFCHVGPANVQLLTSDATATLLASAAFTLVGGTDVGDVTPCTTSDNVFYVKGNDTIYDGETTSGSTTTWYIDRSIDRVKLRVGDAYHGMSAELDLLQMLQPIATGTYELAELAGSEASGHPGLSIVAMTRTCTQVAGRFKVHDFVTDPASGEVLSTTISFEQVCAAIDTSPAQLMIHGCIHYSRTPPAQPAPPDPAKVSVEVRSLALDGTPDQNAWAVFQAPNGTVILDTEVDQFGRAEASLPSGGTLTTIQYVDGGITEYIHTYRAVANGDHIIVPAARGPNGSKDQMLVTYTAPPGASSVAHITGCGSSGTVSNGRGIIDFPSGCRAPTFSMFTLATMTSGPRQFLWQSGLTHAPYGNVAATGTWTALDTATVTLQNVPSNAGSFGITWNMLLDGNLWQLDSGGVSTPSQGTNIATLQHAPGAGDSTIVTVTTGGFSLDGEGWTVAQTGDASSVTIDVAAQAVPTLSAVQQTSSGLSWTQTGSGSADIRRTTWRGLTTSRRVTWYVVEPYSATASTTLSLPASHSADDPTGDASLQLKGATVVIDDYDVLSTYTSNPPTTGFSVHARSSQNTAASFPF